MSEEAFGPHRTLHFGMVLAANALWVLIPLYILYRMGTTEHPFTRRFAQEAGTPLAARVR